VVFLHGLWLLPNSRDRWPELFEQYGFAALTPGWPDDPRQPPSIRRWSPASRLVRCLLLRGGRLEIPPP
jgi:hypothetical protein